jgi:hypothetical protein
MTIFQPATPATNAIVRPPCAKCGTSTLLSRIEPKQPGHDRRTFECPRCQRTSLGCSPLQGLAWAKQ